MFICIAVQNCSVYQKALFSPKDVTSTPIAQCGRNKNVNLVI